MDQFVKGTVFCVCADYLAVHRLAGFQESYQKIPKQEPTWEILMDLKEIVDIAVSHRLSEEALFYFSSKLHDHRKLLGSTFTEFKLKPKHHCIDHYPHLIHCHGPLVELWTMRFEAKHSFFKKVIHDTHNWKNAAHSFLKTSANDGIAFRQSETCMLNR